MRLYNKVTEEVLSLPQGGQFKLMSGRNCPVRGCGCVLARYKEGTGCEMVCLVWSDGVLCHVLMCSCLLVTRKLREMHPLLD